MEDVLREDETLRGAVEAQAIALAHGDLAMFASFAELHALPLLYRTEPLGRTRRFRLGDVSQSSDAHGTSEMRFAGADADAYVLRVEWQRTDMGWKAVALDLQPKHRRMSIWRRLFRRSPRLAPRAREDLS